MVYTAGIAYLYGIVNFVLGNPMEIKEIFWFAVVLAAPGDLVLCLAAADLSYRIVPRMKTVVTGKVDVITEIPSAASASVALTFSINLKSASK